jgi:N-acetylmuramoyl-L-alanine amidase
LHGEKEKDVALDIACRIGARVRALGGKAILTRSGDVFFVPPAGRRWPRPASRPLRLRAPELDAHAAKRRRYSGIETYFLSANATDEHASAVAARENLAAEGWPWAPEPAVAPRPLALSGWSGSPSTARGCASRFTDGDMDEETV